MPNQLFGPDFIESKRSSGYKSTIYAIAEIVDNSVDAGAKEITILLFEDVFNRGRERAGKSITDIVFIDNGKGMNLEKLNGCLTFASGEGKANNRIGAFGVGLPQASVSVCERVDVYSKINNQWHSVHLDVDEIKAGSTSEFPDAVIKKPNLHSFPLPTDAKTIVHWSKIDKIDVSKAETLIRRGDKLLGRIYRYALAEGLSIKFKSILKGNSSIQEERSIIPYDPLFLSKTKTHITETLWKSAQTQEAAGRHKTLDHIKEYNSKFHYSKFTENCIPNETNLPLFQPLEGFGPKTTTINGIVYKWRIRAAFAHKSIRNPGIRNGGGTNIGRLLGEKMNGSKHFKSGNIYFIRAKREIDFGHFGMYTVTNEKDRFWTIEIHFDSDLDNLLGVSNTKQSVTFGFEQVGGNDLEHGSASVNLPEGEQKRVLYADISQAIVRCKRLMTQQLNKYTSEFRNAENTYEPGGENSRPRIPTLEQGAFSVIPRDTTPWTESQKREITKFLKERYMEMDELDIKNQVETFASGLTKTIVLYRPNALETLFELKEKVGKKITFINTNHIYYSNVIEPLKQNYLLREFAVAIEMLISSLAYEYDRLILDDEEKHKVTLEYYLKEATSRLNMFISDGEVNLQPELILDRIRQGTSDLSEED